MALLAGVAGGLVGGLACLGLGVGFSGILRGLWSLVVFLATGRFVEMTTEGDRTDWIVARVAGIVGCVGAGGMCFGLRLCESLENAQAAAVKGNEMSLPVLRKDTASGTWTTHQTSST